MITFQAFSQSSNAYILIDFVLYWWFSKGCVSGGDLVQKELTMILTEIISI